MKKNIILSSRKREQYEWTAEMIDFFRSHPSIAAEELLGVPLLDSQSYVLEASWNASNIMWTCTRGWGKSFMIAVFAGLKALLYPNMDIYIVSRSGEQSKETFGKLEEIAKGQIASIQNAPDVFVNEVVRSSNSDGFKKNPAGYNVTLKNGSKITTLNSVPDNVRGKRSRLVVYDESSFIDDELIDATLPFTSQDSDFVMSTEDNFNMEANRQKTPNQILFASSAGDELSKHAQFYRTWSKHMIAGDRNYFCADIPVTEPLNPTRNGVKLRTMMQVQQYKNMMETNPIKALQEYHNKFSVDGGDEQIIKPAMIRRNETFSLPQLASKSNKERFAIAFDPAHQGDDSIVTVMKILHDEEVGYYGEIVNCTNLFDPNRKQNMNFTEQKDYIRDILLEYSTGAKLYYEGIDVLMIDAGAGGHGTSYATELLSRWVGKDGKERPGLIDRTHDDFRRLGGYNENKDILRLIQPRQKRYMIDNLITLMRSDLIKFNKNYSNEAVISVGDGDDIKSVTLTLEERISLNNMEILKTEATSMRKYGDKYQIDKARMGKVGDDRFDTLAMLAHYLYTLRSEQTMKKSKKKRDLKNYFMVTGGGI